MFEDEMTEEHLATTAEEYYRVTRQEIHDEKLACARAYISALEGLVCMLKRERHVAGQAMLSWK